MKLQNTELTLEKAQNLLGQLGGEQRRWKSQAKDLRSMVDSMPTRILLASAFVIYLGKAPESVREDSVRRWEEIVGMATSTFELKLLSSERSFGLEISNTPFRRFSVENGIIIDQTFTLRCLSSSILRWRLPSGSKTSCHQRLQGRQRSRRGRTPARRSICQPG